MCEIYKKRIFPSLFWTDIDDWKHGRDLIYILLPDSFVLLLIGHVKSCLFHVFLFVFNGFPYRVQFLRRKGEPKYCKLNLSMVQNLPIV